MRSIQRRGRASPAMSSFWPRSCLPIARSVSILASMTQPHFSGARTRPREPPIFWLQSRHPSDSCVVLAGRRSYRGNAPPKSAFRHKFAQPYLSWRRPRGEKSDLVKLLTAMSANEIECARTCSRRPQRGRAHHRCDRGGSVIKPCCDRMRPPTHFGLEEGKRDLDAKAAKNRGNHRG
jgi:hypothetical protein